MPMLGTIGGSSARGFGFQSLVSASLNFVLLDTITGNDGSINTWTNKSYDSSDGLPANETGRVIFSYKSGSSFTGDQQIDSVQIDGVTNTFASGSENYERTQGLTGSNTKILSDYADNAARIDAYENDMTWSSVSTNTNGNGLWLRDKSGTGSTGTGSTVGPTGSNLDFYLYYESSGTTFPQAGWLRTPSVTLDASPSVAFKSSRFGPTMGPLEVWWVSNG